MDPMKSMHGPRENHARTPNGVRGPQVKNHYFNSFSAARLAWSTLAYPRTLLSPQYSSTFPASYHSTLQSPGVIPLAGVWQSAWKIWPWSWESSTLTALRREIWGRDVYWLVGIQHSDVRIHLGMDHTKLQREGDGMLVHLRAVSVAMATPCWRSPSDWCLVFVLKRRCWYFLYYWALVPAGCVSFPPREEGRFKITAWLQGGKKDYTQTKLQKIISALNAFSRDYSWKKNQRLQSKIRMLKKKKKIYIYIYSFIHQ
jgi:hypothetical protein